MKRIILGLAVVLLVGSSIQAGGFCYKDSWCSAKRFYAEVFGGANFVQAGSSGGITNRYQAGYIVSVSLGCYWRDGLRMEAEYAYRRNALKTVHFLDRTYSMHGHFQSSSYMANLLWDVLLCDWKCDLGRLQPFIGGGMGYDVQQIYGTSSGMILKEHKKGFAWQVIAGLSYPISCVNVSLEYRFHQGGFGHLYNHSVGVGFTYNFGR